MAEVSGRCGVAAVVARLGTARRTEQRVSPGAMTVLPRRIGGRNDTNDSAEIVLALQVTKICPLIGRTCKYLEQFSLPVTQIKLLHQKSKLLQQSSSINNEKTISI
ncbi:hypothetical protein [Burkholderia sp. LMG 32019]|uniref:hypothetical protein n=1 Tax=Burkholderia sp. LMG 32019 TaxID=3158173 RepID=UPI003C2B31DA